MCSRLASALPFSYVDVGDVGEAFQFINHIYRLYLSIIYRRFASSQRFVFFTRRRATGRSGDKHETPEILKAESGAVAK